MKQKKIEILAIIFVFCLSLVNCEIKSTEDEVIILRIVESSESLSQTCKNDINATVNAYRDGKAWAIASKNAKKNIYS